MERKSGFTDKAGRGISPRRVETPAEKLAGADRRVLDLLDGLFHGRLIDGATARQWEAVKAAGQSFHRAIVQKAGIHVAEGRRQELQAAMRDAGFSSERVTETVNAVRGEGERLGTTHRR